MGGIRNKITLDMSMWSQEKQICFVEKKIVLQRKTRINVRLWGGSFQSELEGTLIQQAMIQLQGIAEF